MKYSIDYGKHIDLTPYDEIVINYVDQKEKLPEFLKNHAEQMIIVSIIHPAQFDSAQEWQVLNDIYQEHKNFKVRIGAHQPFHELNKVEQTIKTHLKVPAFFGLYATNFDQLQYLLTFNISDVYLVEDICFDLLRAHALCDSKGVQIRAFPNVAQSCVKATPPLKKFFIRPEDMQCYSEVIDVFEFWAEEPKKQDILHRIYIKEKWGMDLGALIAGLDFAIDNPKIDADFGRLRRSCGRRCMRGDYCRNCDIIYKLTQ